jgi:coproporphyrinogen III oxidase-like Fe-S oxidoreductase
VYLGLRTTTGLELTPSEMGVAQSWVGQGWAELDGSRLRLTATGWLRLDSLAADIAARRTNRHSALSKSA